MSNFHRGLLLAVPLGLIMWVAVIFAVLNICTFFIGF